MNIQFTNADDALVAAVRQRPKAVAILIESADGLLQIITGPDMTFEHLNWFIDKAKFSLMSQTNG